MARWVKSARTFDAKAFRKTCERLAKDFNDLAALLHPLATEEDLIEIPPLGSDEGTYAEALERARHWLSLFQAAFNRIETASLDIAQHSKALNKAWRRRAAAFNRTMAEKKKRA